MTALKKVHPIVWTIIIGTMFGRLATSMSMPFLTIYLTKTLGATPFQAAFIVGLSALIGIFMSFIGGHLSDQFGRRGLMLSSVFLFTFVFIGYSYANQIWMFFILAMLNGIARSLFEPASRALLSDVTEKENKLMVYNLRYGAINFGVAIGPLLGVVIGAGESTRGFLLPAIVYFVYGFILWFMLRSFIWNKDDSLNSQNLIKSFYIVRKDEPFVYSLLGMIICSIAYSQFMSTMPQFFGNSPQITNGVTLYASLITFNAITVILLQYPLTRIGKNYSPLLSITVGGTITSLSLILLGSVTSTVGFIIAMFIFTVGEVLMFSMTEVFIDQLAPSHLRGTYFGAMGLNGVGQVIGPWLGGALLTYFGFQHGGFTFIVIGILTLSSLPLFLHVRHLQKKSRFSIPTHTN